MNNARVFKPHVFAPVQMLCLCWIFCLQPWGFLWSPHILRHPTGESEQEGRSRAMLTVMMLMLMLQIAAVDDDDDGGGGDEGEHSMHDYVR